MMVPADGLQANGMASLVIDDPLQIDERFFEASIPITKTELRVVVHLLPDGELQRKLESVLTRTEWEINNSAVRSAITNNLPVSGARLVTVRLR